MEYATLINPRAGALAAAADELLQLTDSGALFDETEAGTARTVAVLDKLLETARAFDAYAAGAMVSPCKRHRAVLAGNYGAALKLRRLVVHLYSGRSCEFSLSETLRGLDADHLRMALEIMESYTRRGETDPFFMALGYAISDQMCSEPYSSPVRRNGVQV